MVTDNCADAQASSASPVEPRLNKDGGISFASPPAPLPVAGQTCGRLTALRSASGDERGVFWLCRCECGTEKEIDRRVLLRGGIQSCGCLRGWRGRAEWETHGCFRTPEHYSWRAMLRRCYNPKDPSFACYGGRGIAVCDEWRKSFAAFFAAVGERPSHCNSIDRIDTNGNYEPGNVRWATQKEQARNTRVNHIVTLDGTKMCLAEAAERIGWTRGKLQNRLRRAGTDNVRAAMTEAAR